MRSTRIIIAFVAFVATFIFSAGLVRILFGAPEIQAVYSVKPRCADHYGERIFTLLQRDIRNGRERSKKLYRIDSDEFSIALQAEAVAEYADASSSMDAGDLPHDFQQAWQAHMKAWRDYSNFLNRMNSDPSRRAMNHRKLAMIEMQFNHEINSTWDEVLRIGRSYGASVY